MSVVRRQQRRAARVDAVNVVGYLTGALGLGVAARSTVRGLRDRGVQLFLTDVDPGGGRSGGDLSVSEEGVSEADQQQAGVTLFHFNPTEVLGYAIGRRLRFRNRFHVIVPFWELDFLPDAWVDVLKGMDVVLTPTTFIADAVRRSVPDAVCVPYPQIVQVPEGVEACRSSWGIPEDLFVFLLMFDARSDPERKNPMAVVEAFLEAFPVRSDVALVIKISSFHDQGASKQVSSVVAAMQCDRRIRILTEQRSYREILGLVASSDVVVSLHRSEGLGLSMMEAMTLGVPVIATGYSGNLDFMNSDNSILIPYRLIPVHSDHSSYRELNGIASWAEADVGAAARAMRSMAEDESLRNRLGEAGSRSMLKRQSDASDGNMVELLAGALAQPMVAKFHRRRLRELRRACRLPVRYPPRTWRHHAAVLLKGLMRVALGQGRKGSRAL